MGHHRYRQEFLFLIVLIVPVITNVVQGSRIWSQESELSRERVGEIREQMALDIGQAIVTRLERINIQEMANNSSATPAQARYSDPAVVAVGWIDGGRLVWPWDARNSDGSAADNLDAAVDVLDRVERDLELPTLPPVEIHRFRTILEKIRSDADSAVQQRAAAALERLSARLRDLEDAQKLQKDFANLRLSATEWQPYQASEVWLVGRAPEGVTAGPLVVAVRLESIRAAVQSDRQAPAGPRFALTTAGDGEFINDKLPGLRAVFLEEIADPLSGSTPERSLWGLSFALVAMLTLLGGYLLWRDVRREARVAELRTQFVSSVSHELKTPLTSIRMFAELIQMSESINAEHSMFLETI